MGAHTGRGLHLKVEVEVMESIQMESIQDANIEGRRRTVWIEHTLAQL